MIKIEDKKISVIIRCKNEEEWIGHTIQSLLDFIYQPEIIIIDNGSKDKSLEISKHFNRDYSLKFEKTSSYTDIKFIEINNYTPGKALNLGVQNSTNDYILVISAHCVLKKFDIKRVIENLNVYSAVFGKQTPIWCGKRVKKNYVWGHFGEKKVINMYSEIEKRYFFHNAFSLFKKKQLEDFPFNEKIVGKEDRYWANNIITHKKEILYDPNLVVDHHYTPNGRTWKFI